MSKSTTQRWYHDARRASVYDEDSAIVICLVEHREDCGRIVSDHNACLGIEDPETTVPELVAVIGKLIDAFDEASQYKNTVLRSKHGDDELLAEARAVLAKTGKPAASADDSPG